MNTLSLGALPGLTIDFLPGGSPTGNFTVGLGSSGDFAPLLGSDGEVLNFAAIPGPTFLPGFITFAAQPSWTFDLTFIEPGVFSSTDCTGTPPAGGQICTPVGSAINWTNTSASTGTASFTLQGTVSDGSGSPPSTFAGVIAATFSGRSYQAILGGGLKQIAYSASASFTVAPQVAAPEPASILSVCGGLLALILLRRKIVR